jgi:two-component system cell cycle sensor histidine kinase/response regulator CckA
MNATMETETVRSGIQPSRWMLFAPATILLVEDEPAVRQITREALEIGGYRVLEADGPIAAERIAADRSTEINILLTDVVMPGMNGPELARQVQQSRPDLVTLFMTGYAESEVLRLATEGSPQKHIQKPFTVNALLERVSDALASRYNREENSRSPQHPSP